MTVGKLKEEIKNLTNDTEVILINGKLVIIDKKFWDEELFKDVNYLGKDRYYRVSDFITTTKASVYLQEKCKKLGIFLSKKDFFKLLKMINQQ